MSLIQPDRKLEGIHGLRGLAALSIVLFHFVYVAKVPAPNWLSFTATHFNLSVLLFFALSALSLYHSRRYAPVSYSAYMVKRFFRIAPLFYLVLGYMLWWGGRPPWNVLLANLTFTFNLIPGQHQSLVWAGCAASSGGRLDAIGMHSMPRVVPCGGWRNGCVRG